MSKTTISYPETGYFSTLMCDYLAEKEALQSFYNRFPVMENFQEQLTEKQHSFSTESRNVLVEALQKQYATTEASEETLANIESLSNSNTFTVTTGHQLNLFTGPLYFLYKIFSVINLSEELKEKHPNSDFVPVYWMATEDHDFDEINYFNLYGKKIAWNRESGGAVGELSTEGLSEVLEWVKSALGTSDTAKKLTALFAEAYTKHSTLTEATRYLGNQLFSKYGLVIVDGNDASLKKAFRPYAKKELLEQLSHAVITETTERLTRLGYPEQVHPREINLFYLADGIRERIIKQDGMYYVNDTDLSFTEAEILSKLDTHPECFSPNALLRPLYQEVILPNLCYTGGGGELAYWFQLKDYFKAVEVPFPMLLLRNSVLLVPTLLSEKLTKLEVSIDHLFLKQSDLRTRYTRQLSEIKIDFSEQKEFLKKQFEALHELAKQTDASFVGAVEAQEKKQLKGLSNLEKRLLKAQKRNLADSLERLTAIQDELFPKKSLQERTVNFSEYYVEYGDALLEELKKELRPLDPVFTVLFL